VVAGWFRAADLRTRRCKDNLHGLGSHEEVKGAKVAWCRLGRARHYYSADEAQLWPWDGGAVGVLGRRSPSVGLEPELMEAGGGVLEESFGAGTLL
jgi:hypothetical protein